MACAFSSMKKVASEWNTAALCGNERMVGQDPSLAIDDEELESAREQGLAICEQHLPSERQDVAAEEGVRRGAIANAALRAVPFRRSRNKFAERAVPARRACPSAARGVQRPERGDGGRALGRVGFAPRGDIAVGERLSVEHWSLQSGFEGGVRALRLAGRI